MYKGLHYTVRLPKHLPSGSCHCNLSSVISKPSCNCHLCFSPSEAKLMLIPLDTFGLPISPIALPVINLLSKSKNPPQYSPFREC